MARTNVENYEHDLLVFWQQLAADRRGWEGERHHQSLVGQMKITWMSDDLGQVSCILRVGQPWPQEVWKLQAELTIGGGSDVARFAADLGRVLG